MALTPDEIAEKEFAFGLRGYDQDEVRAFLHLVAAQVAGGLIEPGAGDRPGGAEPAVPVDVESAQILERANREADDIRLAAEADAEIVRRRADAVLAAAEAAALRLVAEAHARIDQRIGPGSGQAATEAPAPGSATVEALGAEISALVNAREEILQQLHVVRSRVLAAVAAAEDEPVVRPRSTTA
jgi:DivIVA domain-containing protein